MRASWPARSKRLQATSLAHSRPITLALAEDALADLIHRTDRAVRLPDIGKAICEVFGLDGDSLQSNRKGKGVSHPRMLAMWLARKHTRSAPERDRPLLRPPQRTAP